MNARQAQSSNVKVAVRVRPFNKREIKRTSKCVIRMYQNATVITHPDSLHLPRDDQANHMFSFDHSYWSHDNENKNYVSQRHVFEDVGQYVLNNVYSGYNCCIFAYGQTGCLDPNTEVLLYDGSLKKAQEVVVGDVLMGDDSTPRNVLKLFSGTDEMYDIIPEKGDTYRVNKDHVLTLKYTADPFIQWCEKDKRYKVHWYDTKKRTKTFQVHGQNDKSRSRDWNRTKEEAYAKAEEFFNALPEYDKTIDIKVRDYLTKSKTWKRMHKGIRSGVDYPETKVSLDPYMLGLWLGDGTSTSPQITTVDQEIVDYVRQFADSIGCKVTQLKHDEITYRVSASEWRKNPFWYFLKNNNLMGNKHIPASFKYNSREVRLRVLAGLLDTDGHYTGTGYDFIQKNETLLDDVIGLARSLGFACYKSKCKKSCPTTNGGTFTGTYFRCNIGGQGIETIPCILPRKKAGQLSSKNKNLLHTGIRVVHAGRGQYNGFMLDGNHRFLLSDYTVTHNSGKTFTMMGGNTASSLGLIPRICEALFQKINAETNPNVTYNVEISYLEIYAEQIRDLIDPDNAKPGGLKVREHPQTGPYVENLTTIAVEDYYTVRQFMLYGNKHRVTAATKMNDRSSRSHAVFTVSFKQIFNHPEKKKKAETVSQIQLVDLAGSERTKDSGVTGQNFKEATNINQSLTTLGRVISALAKQSTRKKVPKGRGRARSSSDVFVPFRDSVLTWLLKDSLGGNSKTVMIAAISPADINHDETLNTLQYANHAKQIVNQVSINADVNDRLLGTLKKEIDELNAKLLMFKGVTGLSPEVIQQITEMKGQISQSENLLGRMSETWEQKMKEAQTIRGKTIEQFTRNRRSIKRTASVPILIDMTPNLDLMTDLVHYLNVGETKGTTVSPTLECTFVNEDGDVYVVPEDNAGVKVNDLMIGEKQILDPGDRVSSEEGDLFKFRYPKNMFAFT
jgi:hypothetical protein